MRARPADDRTGRCETVRRRDDLSVGEARLRFSTAVTYRATTLVANAVLAALAFSQGTQVWDIVGAVLAAFAIGDLMQIAIAAWFRWRHRKEW